MSNMSLKNQSAATIAGEIGIRLLMLFLFLITEEMEPFHRVIQPEEMWLYKNPRSGDTVPTVTVFSISILVPLSVILIFFIIQKDRVDSVQAVLAVTLTLCLNCLITNTVKLAVGRPRPDFFWRCFPDGKSTPDLKCTGDPNTITEGRKSFPSGHSSVAFAGLGFTAVYIAGKLQCFSVKGQGVSWRLCLAILPLWCGTMIAISRTEDYKHHWQDVLVGSMLGLAFSYLCYRQYFPALNHINSDKPLIAVKGAMENGDNTAMQELTGIVSERAPSDNTKYL
ncbi:phospholipid phosphatase 5-like [Ptychodera flava]|uniref:phospholipid phosphatase 5-like n=1 Tax=Ptychodera flava TaxID=63121 RepID=UPI003969FDA6